MLSRITLALSDTILAPSCILCVALQRETLNLLSVYFGPNVSGRNMTGVLSSIAFNKTRGFNVLVQLIFINLA